MHTKTPYTGDMQALVDCAPFAAVPLRLARPGVVSHLTVVRIPESEWVKPVRVNDLLIDSASTPVTPRCVGPCRSGLPLVLGPGRGS
jgi:hypothetical protein